ncbi:hypothetical protein FRB94_014626 [Tulasnella sp. JGI-2019a]|nr:hypothetical protein FRB93_002806 [Tulasnella sp. JGI-2019a]KAG9007153.1 hypothetical protein FRB94_014626 [Tulasnella sp. JGI-2019a]
MDIELTRHNVLSRGYTPPPEEKVAFYVYNQQKVSAERPPSNPSTILRDYSNEPVAWAPELPPDWHSQAVPHTLSRQVSALPTANQSSQNLASLRGMTGNRGFQASPDRDFADLEKEIMGDGSELDYGVKSDTQEQSMGNRTPMMGNARLIDVNQSQAGRSFRGGPSQHDGSVMFSNTPGRASGAPLPEPSLGPTTPRTTGIHIQIQPPTDPSLSKMPSGIPSRTPSRSQQRSRMEPSIAEDRSVRAPSVTGTQRSRSHAREASRLGREEEVPPLPSPSIPREQSPPPMPPTPSMSETPSTRSKKGKAKGKGKMGPVMVETKYSPSGHVESVTVKMDPTQRDSTYSDASEIPPSTPQERERTRERRGPSTIAEEEITMPVPMPASPLAQDSIAGQWAPIAQEMRAKQVSIAGSRTASRAGSRAGSMVPPMSPQGEKPLHPLTNILRARTGSPTPSQMTHSTQRNQTMSPTRMREGMASPTPSQGSRHTRVRSQDVYDRESLAEQLEALERMEGDNTPTASRVQSPTQQMVPRLSAREAIDLIRTPRTSYSVTPSVLAQEVNKSNHHDDDLCVLLHAADDPLLPDVVKKAVRKAVRSRLKKLGVDDEEQYRRQHMSKGKHNHRISYADTASAAPGWARPLFELLEQAQERLDRLDNKIDASRDGGSRGSASEGHLIEDNRHRHHHDEQDEDELELEHSLIDDNPSVDYEAATPKTPHVPMPGSVLIEVPTAPTPTQRSIPLSSMGRAFRQEMAQESPGTNAQGTGYDPGDEDYDDFDEEHHLTHDNDTAQDDGLEEEVYRSKQREAAGSQFGQSNRSERPLPEIPGSELGAGRDYEDDGRNVHTPTRRAAAPAPPTTTQEITPSSQGPAFARPQEDGQLWAGNAGVINWGANPIPSWQRVHQRLLQWTIVWSMSELERALESTERGHQVDECALTVWTTQCYKRYVRSKTVDNANPDQKVDRLFVPPNVADAINSAVYNGRHGDACSMLKDMWTPFGFDGMPRLLIVLARHRRDANHWVVHRFSIPEGTLSTYDTYPERSLADGRPLGWWFAIRAAWPHAMYPNPDHLVQKLVRIHRPMQLLIDNSVAAAAIWRNLLMGSKAERSVDLIRMRDLINTEVRALKVRKDQGKLALPATRGGWDEEAANN